MNSDHYKPNKALNLTVLHPKNWTLVKTTNRVIL